MHKTRVELARFAGAGVAGLVVDVAVLYLLQGLGVVWWLARAGSFLAAVCATWQINRRYTFQPAGASLWQEWWRYLTAMLGGGVLNYAVYSAVILLLPRWLPLPARLLPLCAVGAGSVVGLALNFISAKFFVFSR